LQAIVARLLAPDVSQRYASATAVHDDLVLASEERPTAAEAAGFPACLDEAPTRRTMAPAGDDDPERTRRTLERPASAASPASAAPFVVPPAAQPPRRTFRSHPVRSLLLLAALFLACNEVAVGFRAGRLGAAAVTRDLDGLQDVWGQYDALSRRSYLRLGIVGLERTMTSRVQALADQVIANYRTSLPTVRERQWQIARDNLQRALILAPANRLLKAELRYCEGHLHRIGGEAELARRRAEPASQQFTEAVSAFREAAELRRDWPDPFLGLARVFIYGLGDIDRATDAIREAKRLGYTPGDRETAQLADGYRVRGDSLWRTARQLVDLPQEQEYLQRANEAYKQAHDLYERIPAFPGVATNLRRVTRAMEQIAERAQERAAMEGLTVPWR
jgi:tetratricopeptide (TPR) repeat protein